MSIQKHIDRIEKELAGIREDLAAEAPDPKAFSAEPEAAYTPPPSPPGSVWWAIDKMRGGAVCECDGHKHRIRDGVLEWRLDGDWCAACLATTDIAATNWRVVEGGGE